MMKKKIYFDSNPLPANEIYIFMYIDWVSFHLGNKMRLEPGKISFPLIYIFFYLDPHKDNIMICSCNQDERKKILLYTNTNWVCRTRYPVDSDAVLMITKLCVAKGVQSGMQFARQIPINRSSLQTEKLIVESNEAAGSKRDETQTHPNPWVRLQAN